MLKVKKIQNFSKYDLNHISISSLLILLLKLNGKRCKLNLLKCKLAGKDTKKMQFSLHKISSSVLAFLMFLSTISFTVNQHYCGDFLVDQSVFFEADTCGMEHEPGIADEKGCSDDSIAIDGQKDLKISFYDLNFDQQVFLVSFTYSFSGLFEEQPAQNIPFANYIPPLLVQEIHILNETFLI